MNREELKQIIPHREPMLLVDESTLDDDGVAHGSYRVRGDEWFLQGHYPGDPIVPGVIQCEMMAQAACVLFAEDLKNTIPLYTGIDKVRFKGQVKPGDRLDMTIEILRIKGPFYFTKGTGYVDGRLVVSGEFSFALIKKTSSC
jgi:3-hydroxyacyl-[acyl-carrier-protein] dehydratase